MSLLMQISDTHFGTERPVVVEALVTLAQQQRPDLIVLSGDITQRAHLDEFRAAQAFTARLGAPLLAIPGNHDIPLYDLPTRLFRPYAAQRAAFGSDLEPVHDSADLLVLGVNTTRAWRHRHGQVSRRQIARVAQRLAAARPAQLRVVVVHQPAAVMRVKDLPNRLRGHAAALRRWAEAGADIVMGGHIHLPYVMAVETSGRAPARRLWVVQAGTAVSTRLRAGVSNSVNLLRWDGGQCLVEQWDFAAASGAFLRGTVTRLEPGRAS